MPKKSIPAIKKETYPLLNSRGISGIALYGSLYIDSLWIDKVIRRQGWGTK